MTTVQRKMVAVYEHQVPGVKRRRWFTRDAAYRSAAIALVNAACDKVHDYFVDGPCRLCRRTCDGSGRRVRHYDEVGDGLGTCENDPTHSYRYRLVGRLARWLRWRDERNG